MTNQCQHGQLARVCVTCEQAAEIAQLREYLDAAQRRGEELRAQVAALEVALGHMQHQRDEARRDHKNCSEVVRRLKAGEL